MNNYPTYLAHYGTKGQKWGQRRYQNQDGSLTPEGKIRYRQGGYADYSFKSHADKGDALIDRANKNHLSDPYYKQVSRAKRHAWGRFFGRDFAATILSGAASGLTKEILKSSSKTLDDETIEKGVNTVSYYATLSYTALNIGRLATDIKSINKAQERKFNSKTKKRR